MRYLANALMHTHGCGAMNASNSYQWQIIDERVSPAKLIVEFGFVFTQCLREVGARSWVITVVGLFAVRFPRNFFDVWPMSGVFCLSNSTSGTAW